MEFRRVKENKKEYLDLLLLADCAEDMVDRYLDEGEMFVLTDPDVVAECVVVRLPDGNFEIKNIAVDPAAQGKGYGRALIEYVMESFRGQADLMFVGTGMSPLTVPFYEKCGFRQHHTVRHFFTDHYDGFVDEVGILLRDMVMLSRDLSGKENEGSGCLLSGPEDFLLIPQEGVKQYSFPLQFTHNAIWDSNAGPDGKLYFGLASEVSTSGYVRLCSYDGRTNEMEVLFRAEDVILPQDRAIRASKFHSSISPMPDGRLIMTTHTTDRSPEHPTWMPVAYYHHLWEGYAGSNIVIYDPETKKAENLGIPVPHETIYGACYEPAHNALFFTGCLRGHLYRYSLDDRRVLDLGKVSEDYSFRLVRGKDGGIYGASRTGFLYRIDPETLEIRDLLFQFHHEKYTYPSLYNNLSIARTGPDGRLYMAGMYSRNIIAYDTETGDFEDMGPYLPADRVLDSENRNVVFGMDFDNDGVLWYCVTSLHDGASDPPFGIPPSLFRWDIARGGEREFLGVVGTPERGGATITEVVCTKDNILYLSSSNHMNDGPQLIAIDLSVFDPSKARSGGLLSDRFYDKDDPDTADWGQETLWHAKCHADNPVNVPFPTAFPPVLLWRRLAPDHIADSAVTALFWDGEALCGISGEENAFAFRIENGGITMLKAFADLTAEEASFYKENAKRAAFPEEIPEDLPFVPGRQYKAAVSAAASLPDGRTLVGTKDGLLAIAGKDGVYALGAVSANGPVHALARVPGKTLVYGISGDPQDFPMLFSWDDKRGLRAVGHPAVSASGREILDVFNITYATALAVSPDGKYLAVGARERLGTVVVYRIAENA